ncbi:flagellar hook-basal body complex protein FliE [Novosphingobium sp.]|uniref:flagellar hook-basal body complex protein FliE n=1 Tax=Novosphingobium sp. TaxID=1874826 RepID=UPI0031D3E573
MSSIPSVGGVSYNGGGIAEIMALRQQIISRSTVLQQVHAPQAASGAQAATATNANGATSGFANALNNALGGVNATQMRAETLSSDYEQGKTQDVAKVMLARQEAQVGFEATLQVRNKLLSAYQDIMKLGV